LRFEAELAALRGRDDVGRGQFLIGSHTQKLCDVHSSDGGRTRTRTWDPLIKSQLLYQLSYAPARGKAQHRPFSKMHGHLQRCLG
jgi:hypothetical protein